MTARLVTFTLAAALAAAAAGAEDWSDRGFVSVSGGYQASSNDFTNTVAITRYAESGSVSTAYAVESGPQLDAGAGVRVWRSLAVAVSVSRFTRSHSASVTAQVPHPFFFARPREVKGESGSLDREETVVHVAALWMIPAGRRFQVALFGGPSFYDVKQGLVSDVQVAEAYPYDTASLASVATASQSKTKVGFHVGADLAFLFSRHAGVGGLIRFSRVSVDFDSPDGRKVSADGGGLQVGGGLRLRF